MFFYAWRLHHTNSCNISVLTPDLLTTRSINFHSQTLGSSSDTPLKPRYQRFEDIENGLAFDLIIISASSLQQFQSICQGLSPFLKQDLTILVELTGFVNLEPFITLNLSKFKNITVSSLMNESDVRYANNSTFIHTIRNEELRLYIGFPKNTSKKNTSFNKTIDLFKRVQKDSQNGINLLVANLVKEFMTYQWKLALPRIIFNPLSIIFETDFPLKLSEQILCKPLVSGLIAEIFKIIKKMDCKLVKGSENEANLWKSWSAQYPVTSATSNRDYTESPLLFYNFYQNYDLELDLLLLQPILLADDHGIRTPYLENLYSILCQFNKMNSDIGTLIFFTRKKKPVEELEAAKLKQLDDDYANKSEKLSKLNQQVKELELHLRSLDIDQTNREVEAKQAVQDLEKNKLAFRELDTYFKDKQSQLTHLERELHSKNGMLQNLQASIDNKKHELDQETKAPPNLARQSLISSPNGMKEMADIAVFGANMNGEGIDESPEDSSEPELNGMKKMNSLDDRNDGTILHNLRVDTGLPLQTQGKIMAPHLQPALGEPDEAINQGNGDTYGQRRHAGPGMEYGQNTSVQFGRQGPNTQKYQQYPYPQQFTLPPNQQQQYQQQPQPQNMGQGGGMYNSYQAGMGSQMGAGFQGPQQGNFQQQQHQQQHSYGNLNMHGPGPNGYFSSPMDQQPPHGLPSNGGIAPIFSAHSMNSQSVLNNRHSPNSGAQQMMAYPQPKQRLSSVPSSMHSLHDGTAYNGPGGTNGSNAYGNVYNGTQLHLKKAGRRTMFPQSTGGSLQGLDMGGRGGMPMPTGPTGERPVKQRPMTMTSPTMSQRKFQPDAMTRDLQLPSQPPLGNHLQLPQSSQSNASSLDTDDTPKTAPSKDDLSNSIQIQVPTSEVIGKPLGQIRTDADAANKKKKRGFFGKKK